MDITINSESLERLKEILIIQSHSTNEKRMRRYVRKRLSIIDPTATITTDAHGNVFFTKGKADVYPTIASHLDTVHAMVDIARVIELDGNLYTYDIATGKQIGTGGDDKVGIFIALELALELPVIKCAFFSREEIGCKGSGATDMEFFKNSCFILQADRKGDKDLVRTGSSTELFGDEFSKEIEPYTKKYGYKETYGMSTDVVELKRRGIKICVFNASCGYHGPHTSKEWCNIIQVFNTLNFFRDICTNLNTKQWSHTYIKPAAASTTYSGPSRHYNNHQNVSTPSLTPWNGPKKNTSIVNIFSWGRSLNTTTSEILDDWRIMYEFFPTEIEEVEDSQLPATI